MRFTKNPLGQLTLFATIVAILIGLIQISPFESLLHHHIWVIFLFLFCLSIATTGFTYMAFNYNNRKFRTNYLLIITIRLLIAMFILGYAVIMLVPNLKTFVINYFIIYLIFVIFELFALNLNLGQGPGNRTN